MDDSLASAAQQSKEMLESSSAPLSSYYGETSLDCVNSSHPMSILEISERQKVKGGPRKMYQAYRGQLYLSIDVTFGNLTVHVNSGKHLSSASGSPCDTFVRVSMEPKVAVGTTCYSDIVCDTNEPVYDEKFTYELISKDYQRRVMVAVFSRDRTDGSSTLAGCMSFGIGNIAEGKTVVDGWYYLLAENLGDKKHMFVRDNAHQQPQTAPKKALPTRAASTANAIKNRLKRSSRRHSVGSVDSLSSTDTVGSSGYMPSCVGTSSATDQDRTGCYHKPSSKPMKMMTVPVLSCHSSHGYGFSLSEGCPSRISKVDGGSAAFRSGLREGDVVIRVNGQSVHRMYPEALGRIIKHYPRCVVLDILRSSHRVPREVAASATCHFLKCLTNDSDQDTSEDEVLPINDRKESLGYVQLDGHPELLDPSFSEHNEKPVLQNRPSDKPVNQVEPTLKKLVDVNQNHMLSAL